MNLWTILVLLARISGFPAMFLVVSLSASISLATDHWVHEPTGRWARSNALVLDSLDRPRIAFYDFSGYLCYTWLNGTNWQVEQIGTERTQFVDMALDVLDRPQIAYASGDQLKCARSTGNSWDITLVDTGLSMFDTKLGIALDSEGKPRIAYIDGTAHSVKYAEWTGTHWSTRTIDQCFSMSAMDDVDLALDNTDHPHISYTGDSGPGGVIPLKYAIWTGIQWSTQTVDSHGDAGTYCSIKLDSNQRPRIASYNSSLGGLRYAWWDGTIWRVETVDTAGAKVTGWYPSLALDAEDNPHISYSFPSDYVLRYAHKRGGVWSLADVDRGAWVAGDTSIAINSRGRPRISYDSNWPLGYAMFVTTPVAPSAVVASAVEISSIVWNWEDVSDEEQGYRARNASDNANLSGDLPRGTTSWVQNSLGPNSPHKIFVEAFNVVAGSNSLHSKDTYTRAVTPTGLSFNQVCASSASLAWSAVNNPVGTGYGVEIASDGTHYTEFQVTALTSTWATGLSTGSNYSFRIRAYNGDNLPTEYAAAISTMTVAFADLRPVLSSSTITRSVGREGALLQLNASSGLMQLEIATASLSESSIVSLEEKHSFPAPNSPVYRLSGTGSGALLTCNPIESLFHPATLTLSYQDAGFDESTLIVARYDERGFWIPLPTWVDNIRNQVTANIEKLSGLYQVMALAAGVSVKDANAFPNPLMPGKPGEDIINLSNLPAGSSVKIFSIRFDLVRELEPANTMGRTSWDGRNESGSIVPSGVYFVRIAGEGGDKILKVAVQR